MTSYFRRLSAIIFLLSLPIAVQASDLTGLWQEYDDDTGAMVALIRIEKMADNVFEGKIERLFPDKNEYVDRLCSHCRGALHNQPLQGLRILSGMKRKDELVFDGGEILDPDDGKTYRCRLRLSQDGNTLEVTGFLNLNWIGQSEIWRRNSE